MRRKVVWGLGVVLALAVVGCGGGSSSPTTPTPSPSNPPPTLTVTITSSGVSTKNITVARGSQVTFVNNDTKSHDIASNPHPEHTECTEINSVGVLNAGQSRQTGNLNTARVCGYHDHNDPFTAAWQGTITIQ